MFVLGKHSVFGNLLMAVVENTGPTWRRGYTTIAGEGWGDGGADRKCTDVQYFITRAVSAEGHIPHKSSNTNMEVCFCCQREGQRARETGNIVHSVKWLIHRT